MRGTSGLVEAAASSADISIGAEYEVEDGAVRINSSAEILALASDANIDLVCSPGAIGQTQMLSHR